MKPQGPKNSSKEATPYLVHHGLARASPIPRPEMIRTVLDLLSAITLCRNIKNKATRQRLHTCRVLIAGSTQVPYKGPDPCQDM